MNNPHEGDGERPKGQRRRRKKKPADAPVVEKGPKDTKVVVVDPRQFSLLKIDSRNGTKSENQPLETMHFPSLDKGTTAEPREPPLNSPWCTRKLKDPFPKLGEASKSQSPAGIASFPTETVAAKPVKVSEPEQDLQSSNKMKRSRRPISLDLSTIMKSKKLHHKSSHLSLKRNKLQCKEALSGNILDSSMPIRKRGKVRENKKIKLSPLKEAIIKDRILKLIALRNNNEVVGLNRVEFKIEVENYLASRKVVSTTKETPNEIINLKPTSITCDERIFNGKFRSYCENMPTPELNSAVKDLIQNLIALQDRAFHRDPVRARARKRFVVGFREASKYLKLKCVKFLIIAPDLEASDPKSSLFTFIEEIKEEARSMNVPCVFALDRRKMGYYSLRKVPVSAFAVLNYEGLEDFFQTVMETFHLARKLFLERVSNSKTATSSTEISQLFSKLNIEDTNKCCDT